ncbi:DUF3168 domain-containing protein [Streptomyces spectabilis]|uniref:DUF3168 domain-containing protein n=1 Tax=Streptomyces spectabilis TaxID=68270 RepID=A0A5P2XBI7_STRST|nr:DUF3168 domain-containing protein [Streptomyces spectabilis]MBB5103295.1 hypothetical protein [Streptomyces spectabilis]MCI3902485.1 DUF3168 domain-containing protein [Streptomyces spectabilis]QEV59822.1 DUF3168 domain-containing protein [Streptomyces spectabilis]GGV13577.1 hypothetical protein GCM10010245_23690 [Streptomyces spectabilis]
MTSALWPLQTAVYAKLTGHVPLMALVSGVYDEVPEQAAHPYVSLGSITESVDDAHNQRGLEAAVVLHVWSKYRGFREAAAILAALDAALDRQPLTVSGYRDVSIAHDQHQQLRDPDPQIRHINVSYRVWLTKI